MVKNPPAVQEPQETGVQSLDQKDPLEESMATHSGFLPGESHGQKSLVGYGPQGRKESDMTETTEKALLIHILVWQKQTQHCKN